MSALVFTSTCFLDHLSQEMSEGFTHCGTNDRDSLRTCDAFPNTAYLSIKSDGKKYLVRSLVNKHYKRLAAIFTWHLLHVTEAVCFIYCHMTYWTLINCFSQKNVRPRLSISIPHSEKQFTK